jgi:hypothetical protein
MTLEGILDEATEERRVCPVPQVWNRIWQMLPERRQTGAGWSPPLPLILGAWSEATDDQKRERFHLHLRWAHDHGTMDTIAGVIASMKPEDWHTE